MKITNETRTSRWDMSRRDFLKTAAIGSAAFLEACQKLSQEEIERIRETALKDLAADPKKYSGIDLIITRGFVKETGKKVSDDTVVTPITKLTPVISWHTAVYEHHDYLISELPEGAGTSLNAKSETKIVNYKIETPFVEDNTPNIKRDFPASAPGQVYKILGRFVKRKNAEGKRELIFEIGRIIPVSPEDK